MKRVFQNIVAATVVVSLFSFTDSLLLTALCFGLLFFICHVPIFSLLGRDWSVAVTGLSLVVGFVPTTLIMLVPGGVLLMFSFHILMYLLYLVALKYRAQAKSREQL